MPNRARASEQLTWLGGCGHRRKNQLQVAALERELRATRSTTSSATPPRLDSWSPGASPPPRGSAADPTAHGVSVASVGVQTAAAGESGGWSHCGGSGGGGLPLRLSTGGCERGGVGEGMIRHGCSLLMVLVAECSLAVRELSTEAWGGGGATGGGGGAMGGSAVAANPPPARPAGPGSESAGDRSAGTERPQEGGKGASGPPSHSLPRLRLRRRR